MNQAHIVTDIGYGDAGKGAITDRILADLLEQGGGRDEVRDRHLLCVRYAGGSQAGHTVVIGDKKHVHSSFTSGALGGFRGHMSYHCPIYPQNLMREAMALDKTGVDWRGRHTVDPLCPMITRYDVAWNQMLHEFHGQHGTVGVGVGATMERMEGPEGIRTFLGDLMSPDVLESKLNAVHDYYRRKLAVERLDYDQFGYIANRENFSPMQAIHHVEFANTMCLLNNHSGNVVFEGAQGVMLDRDHGHIPHVTWGHTTSRNAVELLEGVKHYTSPVRVHYVTRAYQVRHGDGPMTSAAHLHGVDPEALEPRYNKFQGGLRVAQADPSQVRYAIQIDQAYTSRLHNMRRGNYQMHITCVDHVTRDEGGLCDDETNLWLMPPRELVSRVTRYHGPQRDDIHYSELVDIEAPKITGEKSSKS